jgi:Txe/YoeB family toxin of Txe-Axe toxin-antitoxin module
MISFSKSAIEVIETIVNDCEEFKILNTMENFDENFIKNFSAEYDIVKNIYTGEPDKLTEWITQEIFEHCQKKEKMKTKLKNTYSPCQRRQDSPYGLTIFIIAKKSKA